MATVSYSFQLDGKTEYRKPLGALNLSDLHKMRGRRYGTLNLSGTFSSDLDAQHLVEFLENCRGTMKVGSRNLGDGTSELRVAERPEKDGWVFRFRISNQDHLTSAQLVLRSLVENREGLTVDMNADIRTLLD